jgi:hypothetical protein
LSTDFLIDLAFSQRQGAAGAVISPRLAIQDAGLAITQRHHLYVAFARGNPAE